MLSVQLNKYLLMLSAAILLSGCVVKIAAHDQLNGQDIDRVFGPG